MSESTSLTACTFLSSEFLHLIAKWFRFEHFEQVLPHEGHFDFRRACLRPQNRHSIPSLELTRLSGYDFVTFMADLIICMSSHFKDSSISSVASAALQMYTVCCKVRFVICNCCAQPGQTGLFTQSCCDLVVPWPHTGVSFQVLLPAGGIM